MISIIIPTTLKTTKYADLCINSLEQNTNAFDFEILVAENGEGTDYPQGQCRAVNRMAIKAKGDWLLISNDDMYYPKGWDKNFSYPSECFCPQWNWISEPVVGLDYVELDAGRTLEDFDKEKVDNFMASYDKNIVENGFNMPLFIKKSLWEDIDSYDEMYDPWGSNSDSDLEYKIVINGVQPKKHTGIFVYHFGQKSGTFDADKQNYWQKNWDYFIQKWGFDREDTPDIQQANLHIPANLFKDIK